MKYSLKNSTSVSDKVGFNLYWQIKDMVAYKAIIEEIDEDSAAGLHLLPALHLATVAVNTAYKKLGFKSDKALIKNLLIVKSDDEFRLRVRFLREDINEKLRQISKIVEMDVNEWLKLREEWIAMISKEV